MKTFYNFLTEQDAPKPGTPRPQLRPQFAIAPEFREIRKKYLELQNALKNYFDAINNNPSLKNSPEATKIKSMFEKIEDELESIYLFLSN